MAKFGIQEMADIIIADYKAWMNRGLETGDWRQLGIFFLRGQAGVGKTEIIHEIGRRLANGEVEGLPKIPQASPPVQLFFNAAMDPESIAGTPAPAITRVRRPKADKPGEYDEIELRSLVMHYRDELLRAQQYPPGAILFCDEMGRDQPHMRAAQLKLLSPEKTLAGLDMTNFYIITGGNSADDLHKVQDIMSDKAMASRLISFEIEPKAEEWVDWMYEKSEQLQIPTYKEIASFIVDNKSHLIGLDNANDTTSAFRCPRSWTVAAQQLHVHGGGTKEKPAQLRGKVAMSIVQGIVGKNAAADLANYLNKDRVMTLTQILKGDFQVDKDSGRLRGQPFPSTVKALQHHLATEELTEDQGKNLAKFLKAAPADITSSISIRGSRKILPKNTVILTKNGAQMDFVRRIRRSGKQD